MTTQSISGATVLVADDHATNRELLAEVLGGLGCRVLQAANGDEAIAAMKSHPVDLVLLDVVMPGEDGFSVCRRIKSNPATRLIPTVLITALRGKRDRITGIDCGADDFLTKPVDNAELVARVRSLLRLKHFTDELECAETVLASLAMSIEAKDPYTEGHCQRLSSFAVRLAASLGLGEEHLKALERAGVVHDIGKVAVPEAILLKPGPLDEREQQVMRQHPLVGERICAPLKAFRLVLPVIRHHHEKMDGSGYPDGLRGPEIPLSARILSVVDVFDALTTDRPYRRALSQAQALRVMRQEVERGWWDGDLVERLAALLAEDPALAAAPGAADGGSGRTTEMRSAPAGAGG